MLNEPCPALDPAGCGGRYTGGMASPTIKSWSEWYRFARETLRYEKIEATHYANLRYVEEQNRAARVSGVRRPHA